MNRKYRKTIIAGNWKMNKLPSEARPFVDELRAQLPKTKTCDTALCVPYPDHPQRRPRHKGQPHLLRRAGRLRP